MMDTNSKDHMKNSCASVSLRLDLGQTSDSGVGTEKAAHKQIKSEFSNVAIKCDSPQAFICLYLRKSCHAQSKIYTIAMLDGEFSYRNQID